MTELCHVPISIGNSYSTNVICDVVDMDACYVLLGRPWQFDTDVIHLDRKNVYLFTWLDKKTTVIPSNGVDRPKVSKVEGKTLILMTASETGFCNEAKESGMVYAVVVKGESNRVQDIPKVVRPLLEEFKEIIPEELPNELPHMRDIQHCIDLVPRVSLPNLSHYRMSPKGAEEMNRQVEELLQHGRICESMSPCVVSALLTPKKYGSWHVTPPFRNKKGGHVQSRTELTK